MSLIDTAFSAATSFLGGIQGYLIAGGLALVIGLGGGVYAGYRWEAGTVASLKLADAQSATLAVQAADKSRARQDAVTLGAALAEAKAQTKIVTQTQTITKEIPRYVTVHEDAVMCVPYGLVRLLDASALQTDPSGLGLPSGKSDDDCTPLKATDLAVALLDTYGDFQANAEQLTALQAWVVANQKAQAVP